MATETEIPVLMRFTAETEELQQGAKEVEGATGDTIERLEKLAEAAAAVSQQAVDRVTTSYQSLRDEIQKIAAAAAAAGAATAAGITAAGVGAVKVAKNFEDLRARLEGLTGDAQKAGVAWEEAIVLASRSPFSVESIIAATSQLEAFGVGGKENLELVANIAAATGGRLEEVALRTAKALAGSSEGFQALRDTAGITGEKLAKFGANLSSASLVSVKSAKDIKLAVSALKELGKAEFSGQIEKASDTLSGALNNAEDAIANFMDTIGRAAIPAITALARGFATGLDALTEFIKPFAPLVTALGAMSAAIAGAVGVLGGFAIPLAGVVAQSLLMRKGVDLAVGAIGRFAGGAALLQAAQIRVAALGSAFSSATLQISLFNGISAFWSASVVPKMIAAFTALQTKAAAIASALAPFAPLILAAGAAATVGTLAINAYASAQQRLGQEVEKSSKNLALATTQYRTYATILEQASGKKFSFNLDIGDSVKETKEALDQLTAIDVADALRAAGKGANELTADLKANRTAADETRARLVALREALQNSNGETVTLRTQSEETQKALSEMFGSRLRLSVEEINRAISETDLQFQKLGQGRALIEALIERIGQIPASLDAASKSAEALSKFLGFANGINNVDQLRSALGRANGEIVKIESNLMAAVGTLDRLKLAEIASDPKTDSEKADAIKNYLQALNAQGQLEQKITAETDKAAKAKIAAYELVTERRKVLGDLTLAQERERVKAQLDMVKAGSAEELEIYKRLTALTTQEIEKKVAAVQESIAAVRSQPGVKQAEVANELRASISALEEYRQKNSELFRGAPEAADRYRKSIVQLRQDLRSAEASQLTEQFGELQKILQNSLSSFGTTSQQLSRTGASIEIVKQALAAGTIDQQQAEQYLVQLERDKLNLTRQQTDEKLKQAGEIAQLEQRALEEEIQILELRQQAGEKVDAALRESREKLLQSKLDAIEREKEAAIKAGADEVLAEKKAALERQSIMRKEATEAFKQVQSQKTPAGRILGSANALASATNQLSNTSQRQPGLGFSGIQTSGFADFGSTFGISQLPRRAEPPKWTQVQQRVEQQQKIAESRIKSGSADKISEKTEIYKTHVVIQDTSASLEEENMKKATREFVRKTRQKHLRGGSPSFSPINQAKVP